jgi:hypothetical protein
MSAWARMAALDRRPTDRRSASTRAARHAGWVGLFDLAQLALRTQEWSDER